MYICEKILFKEWDGNFYHYIDDARIAQIIKISGELKSSMALGNGSYMGKYIGRNNYENPIDYFKFEYEKRYKDLLKKPFKTWGIWSTPTDLFSFKNKFIARATMSFKTIVKYDSIFEVNDKNIRFSVDSSKYNTISKIMKYYNTTGDIRKLYWYPHKQYLFENLPSLVIFTDSISIDNFEWRQ
jgi:hypothetical protein